MVSDFEIKDDYSVRIRLLGQEENYPDGLLMSPRYDRVDRYPNLGHAIMRVITAEGMLHIHVDDETGVRVIEATGCPSMEPCKFMLRSDYEKYLEVQQNSLEDWEDFDDPLGECEL